jgi:hypothetical protein
MTSLGTLAQGYSMRQSTLRVEPVDNQHPAWGQVLAAIFRTGNQHSLQLGEDGWLSSRQTVLAAFDGSHVVGHLCFSLHPFRSEVGQARVNSRVDSFAVESDYTNQPVDEMLHEVAEYRARLMRCPAPRVAMPA